MEKREISSYTVTLSTGNSVKLKVPKDKTADQYILELYYEIQHREILQVENTLIRCSHVIMIAPTSSGSILNE